MFLGSRHLVLFCCDCEQNFKTKEELTQHKKMVHLNLAETSNCWVCGQLFKTFKVTRRHRRYTLLSELGFKNCYL